MEEADLLCDKIAIMVEGSVAAQGASMDLKQSFGVGYRLTIVKQRPEAVSNSRRRCSLQLPEIGERAAIWLLPTTLAFTCKNQLIGHVVLES